MSFENGDRLWTWLEMTPEIIRPENITNPGNVWMKKSPPRICGSGCKQAQTRMVHGRVPIALNQTWMSLKIFIYFHFMLYFCTISH